MIDNNFQIINDGNTQPTFHIVTEHTDYHELLDFFIGSPLLAGNLSEYAIINNNLLDSDHSAIHTTFNFGSIKEINKSFKPKMNFAKANWNKNIRRA